MKQTPIHDLHESLGARMVEFAGWHMPIQYGPILDEVRCVRSEVGLFDLSHMGRLHLEGSDAVAFVDRVATNFCARMPVGSIRYSLLCREDGNPIDDLLVYKDTEAVDMVVNASNTEAVKAWLSSHRGDMDVAIEDETDDVAMLALQGQRSAALLERVTEDLDLSSVKYYRFASGTVMGIENTRISRTGYTGEDGFELYLPVAEAARVWTGLLELGAEDGLKPIGLGARDTLRLEAGMALYGHEIDAEHNPIEAGLAFGVSFAEEKGDWIGRAALEKIAAAPRRRLIGLTTPGPRVPRQGYPLFLGDQELGEVCSGSPSPTLDVNIATAYVPQDAAPEGTELEMDIRGKRQACTVRALPFYSRTRK